MNNLISLITPTGGRPEAFRLLERYVAGQTYTGPLEWIVVDDGERPTAVRRFQTVIRREPFWSESSGPTLAANLAAGLQSATGDRILILEDDECYLPDYIANMAAALDRHPFAGQSTARYYNVRTRRYMVIRNQAHASLCQTGFRREAIGHFTAILASTKSPFLDIPLWQMAGPGGLDHERLDVVSIKGMPGRPGIGAGHRGAGASWSDDPGCRKLTAWIGDRYLTYLRYYRPPVAAAAPVA